MALFPSNMSVKGTIFPNYAGRNNVDKELTLELETAGITVDRLPNFLIKEKEVKSGIYGKIEAPDMPRANWSFERAWYYWIARGPGISPRYAQELYLTHGTSVRVEGHAGCVSPLEYNKGFAVGSYHVDTAEGLKALADTIKKVLADASLNNDELFDKYSTALYITEGGNWDSVIECMTKKIKSLHERKGKVKKDTDLVRLKLTYKNTLELGLVKCTCGHPPSNHFLDQKDQPCAHCECSSYKERIHGEVALSSSNGEGCPCLYTTPCHKSCTCVNGGSSTGCKRCAAYGGKKQRKEIAKLLAKIIDEGLKKKGNL